MHETAAFLHPIAGQIYYGIMLAMTLAGILPFIQLVLSVLLICSILLQQTGASLGGAFGGDNFSAAYHTRRGSELFLFWASIVIAALFAATALLILVL